MRCAFAWGVALLVNAATTAGADTLADVLHANGLSPPATLPDLDRQLANRVVTQEGGETVIVYEAGHPGGSARLVGLRLGPGGGGRLDARAAHLRTPTRIRYHEIPRRDFEVRFGRGALGTALKPASLKELFATGPR